MILACFSATSHFWCSNDENSLPQVEDATKCYSNKLIWIEILAQSKCRGVSNSWSKYLTANFTILLFSETAKDTQKWIWNSCLEWPKAGIVCAPWARHVRALNTLQQLLARCENVMDAVKTLLERRVDAMRTLCTRYNWQIWYF